MATFSKQKLNSSTVGRGIAVAATSGAGSGTAIHATGTSSTIFDEVWLYASNPTASAVLLTIEYGGTTTTSDLIKISIPSQTGLTLVVAGLVLSGTGSAATNITAFAATANAVEIFGYVNRIA